MNNTIDNAFINGIFNNDHSRDIIAVSDDGREIGFTYDIFELLKTDKTIATIYDANTGEIIYTRDELTTTTAATAAEPAPASDEPAAGPEPEQPATGYIVSHNEQFNSVEITFTSKPGDAVRDALKARGFRWHRARGLWYGYADADEITAAIDAAIQGDATPAPKKAKATKPAPVNKYGVKVGDLFRCSWGYDQTQNDFYQVIALCGSSSVRVREVCPEMIESRGISWGAEDRIYNTNTHGELLPPVENSCFIKDQERGDLKKLKSYAADGVSNPQFAVSSYANAYHCGTDTTKVYESWYR